MTKKELEEIICDGFRFQGYPIKNFSDISWGSKHIDDLAKWHEYKEIARAFSYYCYVLKGHSNPSYGFKQLIEPLFDKANEYYDQEAKKNAERERLIKEAAKNPIQVKELSPLPKRGLKRKIINLDSLKGDDEIG